MKTLLSRITTIPPVSERRILFAEVAKVFCVDFTPERNDHYVFYRFMCSLVIMYIVFSVLIIFSASSHLSNILPTPDKLTLLEKYLSKYSILTTLIGCGVVLPIYYIKMRANNFENKQFIPNNPLWATPELREKRKIHMIVTACVCSIFCFLILFKGYYSVFFFIGKNPAPNVWKSLLIWLTLSLLTMPFQLYLLFRIALFLPLIVSRKGK